MAACIITISKRIRDPCHAQTWKCVRQTSAAGRARRAGRERVAHPPTAWIPDIPPRLVLPGLGQGAGGIYFVRQPSALSRKTSLPEEEAVNRQAAPPIVNRPPSIVPTPPVVQTPGTTKNQTPITKNRWNKKNPTATR